MINAWSLAYDVLNGTLDENFPIKENKMSKDDIKIDTSEGVVNVPSDINLDAYDHSDAWYDYTRNDPDRENPFTDPVDRARAERVVSGGNTAANSADELTISIPPEFQYSEAVDHFVNEMPSAFNTFSDNDDSISHHIEVPTGDFVNFDVGVGNTASVDTLNLDFSSCYGDDTIPTPGIESNNPRKYKEDESIKALQDYISTTYGAKFCSLLKKNRLINSRKVFKK